MSTAPPPTQAMFDALITAGWHLRAEDSMALASLSILLYDHILTFGDEVEHIWKKKMTPLSILYLINRYFIPAAYAVCLVALFSPDWTIDSCYRFAKFEGVVTVVAVMVAEAMLILRVYAVHQQSKVVLVLLLTIWIAQLCFMSYTLVHSGPVIIPPSPITYGCILVADPKIGSLAIFFVVPSMVFDTTTFFLLLLGLYQRARRHTQFSMFKLILRDGFLYFCVVFFVNTAWTVTGLTLQSDLKNILSFFSTAITVILIGRLTLNLRMHATPLVYESTSVTKVDSSSWARRLRPFTPARSKDSDSQIQPFTRDSPHMMDSSPLQSTRNSGSDVV